MRVKSKSRSHSRSGSRVGPDRVRDPAIILASHSISHVSGSDATATLNVSTAAHRALQNSNLQDHSLRAKVMDTRMTQEDLLRDLSPQIQSIETYGQQSNKFSEQKHRSSIEREIEQKVRAEVQ